jgi:hypothetical protein
MVPVLNEINPDHALKICFFMVNINIILRNKPVTKILFHRIFVVSTKTPEINGACKISLDIPLHFEY